MIGKRWIIGCWIVAMGGCLMACTPQAVREAEDVVAQADSLWHAGKQYGIDEGDSATLAQAYKTFGKYSVFSIQFSDTYAHACYHYGKLLRAKENPVEAMQAFIAATHSGTKDYHILGRIYSNMGSICHLAGEFQLSYDMYEKSADMFIRNCDSTAYFYAINDMAYELAEQGKKDSAFMVLGQIDRTKIDSYAIMKIFETKAEACLYAHMYDSAIYYTSPLLSYSYTEPEWLLIRAQAYSLNGENDSAVYYANRALSITNEIYHQNNALYILTNNDTTKDIEAVRVVAADRADVQKLIEIKRSKCAQAVQYLEQNLNAERNITWLYAILATLVVVGACIYAYIHRKRRQHALLSQQVEDLAIQNIEAETQHEKIIGDIEKHKRTITDEIEKNCQLIIKAESFPQNIYWKEYDKMRASIDCQFYMIATKLSRKNVLNETEIRLCILVLLNLKRVDISRTLPYASSSIGKLKDQTAKKLNTTGKNLRDYLIKMAVD